jgi:hypothetical protein
MRVFFPVHFSLVVQPKSGTQLSEGLARLQSQFLNSQVESAAKGPGQATTNSIWPCMRWLTPSRQSQPERFNCLAPLAPKLIFGLPVSVSDETEWRGILCALAAQ